MVVVTCLLMIDDISNTQEKPSLQGNAQVEQIESHTDLAVVESEE